MVKTEYEIKYIKHIVNDLSNDEDCRLYQKLLKKIHRDICVSNNFYEDEILFNINNNIICYTNIHIAVDSHSKKMIGFILGDRAEDLSTISFLCVDANYRKRGIASKLINEFTKDLKKSSKVRVEVNEKSALKYFIKNGFKCTGQKVMGLTGLYLVMERSL